ncbi:MAG: hypothetical protein Q8R74_04570 [Methylophilus sp.]|nr:hypothetical protein [Methylophilus sp.]
MRTQICPKCNYQFTEADKFWDEFQINGKCPNCDVHESNHSSGSRFIVAMLSWLFSSVGVVFSLTFFFVGLMGGMEGSLTALIAFLPLVAWVSLGVMTVDWVKNRQCHSLWLIIGALSGIFSAVVFHEMFVVFISAIPLAIYLVFWHVQSNIAVAKLPPNPSFKRDA